MLALGACGPGLVAGLDGSPAMEPGSDCQSCHKADGSGRGQPWTVAGTLFGAPNAKSNAGLLASYVLVTDADGYAWTLRTNESGNFYIAETLKFPLQVEVHRGDLVMRMSEPVTTGSCNSCHTQPARHAAPGRLFAP